MCPKENKDPSEALLSIRFPIQDVFLHLQLPHALRCLEDLDQLYQEVAAGFGGWQSFFDFDASRNSTLRWRTEEAKDFAKYASSQEQHLINLYLPLLTGELLRQQEALSECKWVLPAAKWTSRHEKDAHSLNSHIFEHFQEIGFDELVSAGMGFQSSRIDRLHACARRIYTWYQVSSERRDAYELVSCVSSVRLVIINTGD